MGPRFLDSLLPAFLFACMSVLGLLQEPMVAEWEPRRLFDALGRSWTLLYALGRSWMLLDALEHSWMLLDVVVYS